MLAATYPRATINPNSTGARGGIRIRNEGQAFKYIAE
jgi:hypothetical protein